MESVSGVGKKISYQFLAIICDYQCFYPDVDGSGAKYLSSYLGYGMKEYSSGAKSYRLGISKRGNSRWCGMMYMGALNAIRRDKE